MRPFKIYNGRLVRISNKIDKITMLDWLLHLSKNVKRKPFPLGNG